MDVEDEVHTARHIEFDKEGDGDVLSRSTPRKLAGLDLAESRLAAGDVARPARWPARRSRSTPTHRVRGGKLARPVHPCPAAILTETPSRPSRNSRRRWPPARIRLISWSHLPGPYARPGMQARRGGCRVSGGAEDRDGSRNSPLRGARRQSPYSFTDTVATTIPKTRPLRAA